MHGCMDHSPDFFPTPKFYFFAQKRLMRIAKFFIV